MYKNDIYTFFISDATSSMLIQENESIDSQSNSKTGDDNFSMDEEQNRRISEDDEVNNINSLDIFSESMF